MKLPRPPLMVLGYAALALALGTILIKGHLPDQILAILMLPPVVASVNQRRAVHLSMIAIFMGVSIWVTRTLALFPNESIRTIFVAGVTLAATCEAVGLLARRRRRAEVALLESEGRYRELFENANDIVYTHDLSGRLLSLNKAGERITGYAGEETSRMEISQIIPDEYRPRILEMVQRKLSGKAPTRYELEIIAKDGHRVPLEVSTRLVYRDGEPCAIQGIARDITERKRAEETLREESAFRRAIIDSSAEGLCVCHETEVFPYVAFTVWNKRMTDITGYTMEEINRFGWYQSLYPDRGLQDKAIKRMARMRDGDNLAAEEWEITRKDGKKRVLSISTSLIEGQGHDVHVLALMTDVSDRKRAEEERRRLEAQVQHAQKLESLGVLAGGIAHDFNNLLIGILGNAGLALTKIPADSPARTFVEKIESTGRRAAELTNQMLAYSGKGAFVVEALDMAQVVREMGHLLETSISKKAILKYDLAPNLPLVEGDPTQLRQVVMNLITNGSDALGDQEGTITVKVSAADIDPAELPETAMKDALTTGRYLCIEVADTGCGMNVATQARMFDPFFSTKFAGRGLGLAAVLGIIRNHRGAILVNSEPGSGSSLKVLLPAVGNGRKVRERTSIERRNEDSEAWRLSGVILVADDEETVREVAQETFTQCGATVLTASDGREAVEVFRAHADEIKAVLLDLTMPHMSGEEVFREIRRIRPNVVVILSSGYTEEDATNRFRDGGPAAFIQKPYLPSELVDKLRSVLPAQV